MAAETTEPARRTRPGAPRRLRRESSADQAAAHIRRLILSGEIRTGERLMQDEIADELGVSRIPVREAIIALDREGLVRFESNRGAHVAGLAASDVMDHYELRGLVFGLIGRRVVESATPPDIAALAALARSMRTAEPGDFPAVNDRFIAQLLELAASARLAAALMVTPPIIPSGFFELVPEGRRIQERGIAAFVKALKAGDAAAADDALVTMLRRQGAAVVAALGRTGVITS